MVRYVADERQEASDVTAVRKPAPTAKVRRKNQPIRLEPLDILPPAAREAARRLREFRIKKFDSVAAAARTMGIKLTTLSHHENGRRAISVQAAAVYAKALDVQPEQILYGRKRSSRKQPLVRIVGSVGRDGIVDYYSEPLGNDMGMLRNEGLRELLQQWSEDFDATVKIVDAGPKQKQNERYAAAPPGISHAEAARMQCLTITTPEMSPVFMLGDEAYFYPPDPAKPAQFRAAGQKCLVTTRDGTTYTRMAHSTRDGVTLLGIGAMRQIKIPASELVSICPIAFTKHDTGSDIPLEDADPPD